MQGRRYGDGKGVGKGRAVADPQDEARTRMRVGMSRRTRTRMRMPHLMASFTITALYVWTMLVACQSLFAHVLASVCALGYLDAGEK